MKLFDRIKRLFRRGQNAAIEVIVENDAESEVVLLLNFGTGGLHLLKPGQKAVVSRGVNLRLRAKRLDIQLRVDEPIDARQHVARKPGEMLLGKGIAAKFPHGANARVVSGDSLKAE